MRSRLNLRATNMSDRAVGRLTATGDTATAERVARIEASDDEGARVALERLGLVQGFTAPRLPVPAVPAKT